MARYRMHRYTTVAVAFVFFIAIFVLTACGSATPSSSSSNNGPVVGDTLEVHTYNVDGKPLNCVFVEESFMYQDNRSTSMSCDWVAYHQNDEVVSGS